MTKKKKEKEVIDFNDPTSVASLPPTDYSKINRTIKNIIMEGVNNITLVNENEIVDIGRGDELNRTHAELVKLFEKFSFSRNSTKKILEEMGNQLLKLQANLFSCDNEEEKKALSLKIDFLDKETEHFTFKYFGRKKRLKIILIDKKPELLIDIWLPNKEGKKDEYQNIIDRLKRSSNYIDKPFLDEINGELHWLTGKGNIQYLKGFIWTCIKKKWIVDTHSAPKLKSILSNTFNIKFSATPFKNLRIDPPAEKYLLPFKNLPDNA